MMMMIMIMMIMTMRDIYADNYDDGSDEHGR